MPASPAQINAARTAIQTRADNDGDNNAKIVFATPGGDPIELIRVGNIPVGSTWEDPAGPMEMFMRGLVDTIVDLIAAQVDQIGTIKMWNGGAIPSGWALCDGANGTPDLRDKFILGGETSGATGGSDTTSPPSETIFPTGVAAGAVLATGTHTHTHVPPFHQLVFIMRIA